MPKVTIKTAPILWRPRKPEGLRGLVGGYHLFTIEPIGYVGEERRFNLLAIGQPGSAATAIGLPAIQHEADKFLESLLKVMIARTVCETCKEKKKR